MQQLMGVKKNLLSEGRITRLFGSLLSDVLNGNSSQISRAMTRMANRNAQEFTLPSGRSIRLLDTEVNDILNAIRNNTGLDNLGDNSKVFIREILRELGHLNPQRLWDDYIDEIIQQGGNERSFFEGLERALGERNPNNPMTTNTLRDALNQRFPDDQEFVNQIFPYIDGKFADFKNKLLKLRNGRLVREISPAIDDFNRNVLSLNSREIDALRKSSFIEKVRASWRNGVEMQDEIKRLFKTLERGNLEPNEVERVEQAILDKMNIVFNWKMSAEKYLKKFIEQLGESGDASLIKLKDKLEKLKPEQGWHVARKITSEMSAARKEWEAFKRALIEATSLERKIINPMSWKRAWINFTREFRRIFSSAVEETVNNKSAKNEGIRNLIAMGSRRGFPNFSKYTDGDGNLLPDFYEDIRKYGKNPLLMRSLGYEWFLRGIKFKLYYAFLETLIPAVFLKSGISEEDHQCALNLADSMKKAEITTSDKILEMITDGQTKLFPPCVQDLIKKDEKRRLTNIVLLADYMVSPGSVKDNYFFPQLRESFLQFSGLDNITAVIPGYLDDILFDLPFKIYKYIRLYDKTGVNIKNDEKANSETNQSSEVANNKYKEDKPSFLTWCASKGLLPSAQNSWNDVSKIGTTNDGKQYKLKADGSEFVPYPTTPVVTTDTNEIKNLLKDWMNANGWKDTVGDYDFEYMKNMGDNKWSYESSEENDDGTPKMYYFLFDPIKKTFKRL